MAGFMRNFYALRSVMCLALVLFVNACSPVDKAHENLTELRIGILPDQGEEALKTRYAGLFEHLSGSLGVPYRLVMPATYDELLTLFRDGKVDLAYFGGFTFIRAHRRNGAVPLVMRDVDTRFTSLFLVRTVHPVYGKAGMHAWSSSATSLTASARRKRSAA